MQNFKNVLYLTVTPKIAGGATILFAIAKNLSENGFYPLLLTQEDGELVKRFLEIGGKVFIQKLPAWRKSKYFISRYFSVHKITNIVRANKIDLIHCNNYRLNPYALYVSKFCKIPAITHVHDILDKRHIYNFLLHKSQNLIVPSDCVRNCFGGFNKNIFKVPNGIDINKFRPEIKGRIRKEFNINRDDILIGMVAYFTETKGHKFFIEAASIVKDKINNVKFMIVGDNLYGGNLTKEELQKFAREKNVFKEIIFTGKRDDVPQILCDWDIFVLPSENESFSLALIEAMAARLPVIINKFSGGPSEIIENGKEGLAVDCRNPNELAENIVNLIKNKTLREKFAEEGYKKVKQYFDLPILLSNIKNIYKEILGS